MLRGLLRGARQKSVEFVARWKAKLLPIGPGKTAWPLAESRVFMVQTALPMFSGLSMRMVGLGRVELPTRSLGNCCSIHLSYSPAR